nr:hypothetical protein [Mycobacterium gordonae]
MRPGLSGSTRDAVEAYLTFVFMALARSREVELIDVRLTAFAARPPTLRR